MRKKRSDSNRIKVLRVKTRLTIGGPDTHVLLLNTGLDKEKFASYLVTGTVSNGEYDAIHIAKELGVKPIVIPELKRNIMLRDDIIAFIKLFNIIRRVKPDIVHTHTAKAGTLGRFAAIINRVPIRLHTFHGHVFHSYFNRLSTGIYIMIEKILARFTHKIIVISKSQLDDVAEKYKIAPEKKCSIIPLGLDLSLFLSLAGKKDLRGELSIDREMLVVGMVGRLVDVKNHRMFLEVVAGICRTDPDIKAKFMIVGDGPLRNDLEGYATELNIKDRIIFTGWRRDLGSVYNTLDIACLTSLNEGTPISLIEAMASGKAVLSTDVGGVRDVVTHGETGLLVSSGDIQGFSSSLVRLLSDRDLRDEMGKRGRSAVSEKFSKERLVRDIERLYVEELVSKKI